jgi:hypothetical protein
MPLVISWERTSKNRFDAIPQAQARGLYAGSTLEAQTSSRIQNTQGIDR